MRDEARGNEKDKETDGRTDEQKAEHKASIHFMRCSCFTVLDGLRLLCNAFKWFLQGTYKISILQITA